MSLIDTGKLVIQAIQESDNIAANRYVLEMQAEALDMQREHDRLIRHVQELEDKPALVDAMRFDQDSGLYFQADDETPFCQKCWEKQKVAAHLRYSPADEYTSAYFHCNVCEASYDRRNLPMR